MADLAFLFRGYKMGSFIKARILDSVRSIPHGNILTAGYMQALLSLASIRESSKSSEDTNSNLSNQSWHQTQYQSAKKDKADD